MTSPTTNALLARMGHRLHLTDAGLETTLIFHDGIDLPQFAAFPLLNDAAGRRRLEHYFNGFLDAAEAQDLGFVLDTPTWRASAGWGQAMGLSPEAVDQANRDAVALAQDMRALRRRDGRGIVINGAIGPHGDAYAPELVLSPEAAQNYHRRQIEVLAEAGADLVTAFTLSSTGEAIGIARAAAEADIPVALSFTVETDGRLNSGVNLADAIAQTDAATAGYAAWFGINCAHPDHFRETLTGPWVARLGSLRANASRQSHAELDNATELDDGDPRELALDYARLLDLLPGLRVVGGCCGTDLRHVSAIAEQCGVKH